MKFMDYVKLMKVYRVMKGGHWERWFLKDAGNNHNISWLNIPHKEMVDGGIVRLNCETHSTKNRNRIIAAVFLFIILIIASIASCQEFPDFLIGDNMGAIPGPHKFEAYIEEYYDANPWSSPNPEGVFFVFGDVCFTYDFMEIKWNVFAHRLCEEAPFGSPGDSDIICKAYSCKNIFYPTIRLRWNEEAQSYIEVYHGVAGTHFTAVTCSLDMVECKFYQGAFEIIDDFYVVSDLYTFETWRISKREQECISIKRRSGRRLK